MELELYVDDYPSTTWVVRFVREGVYVHFHTQEDAHVFMRACISTFIGKEV